MACCCVIWDVVLTSVVCAVFMAFLMSCFGRSRWGDNAYFRGEAEYARLFERLLSDDVAVERMSAASRAVFNERFTWAKILGEYEELLTHWYPRK